MPEWIVFLEQDQNGEVGEVPEDTGHCESAVRRTPQRGRRAIVVKALQMHRPMRLQFIDLVDGGD